MSLLNTLIPAFNRQSSRCEPAAKGETSAIKPAYDVKETAEAYALTVYLPGVTKDGLELTAEDGVFALRGTRTAKQPEGWTALYRETTDEAYALTFSHDNIIDVDKISAELKDGVLKVTLPKTEAVKPRKIAVA